MIFLSVKFEKEACLVVNITDFSPSKFFLSLKFSIRDENHNEQ